MLAKSTGTMHVLQVHPLVANSSQTEFGRDTTAALVMYSVHKNGRYLFELQDIWY
jgi:hypothetical protein